MKTIEWIDHSHKVPPDPYSGAALTRYVGSVFYCEEPKTSPDGKRFFFQGWDAARNCGTLNVLDLETGRDAVVRDKTCLHFNSGYSDYIYFWPGLADPEHPHLIKRLCMSTMEIEPVVTLLDPPVQQSSTYDGHPRGGTEPCFFVSASPKGDFFIYMITRPHTCWLMRADLKTGRCEKIFEHPEIVNSHLQVEPYTGCDIFIQHNLNSKVNEHGDAVRGSPTTHFFLASDGTNKRDLAIGEPWTHGSSGHSAWIGNTGRVAIAVDWIHNEQMRPDLPPDWSTDPRHPGVSLFTVGPGESRPTPIVTPEHRIFHVSVSRCGKYFVCNSVPTSRGSSDIVVGNLRTGKYRALITRCWCRSGPTATWPCSLPIFTIDLKYVIYRAKEDPSVPNYGGYSIFTAELPKGFLASLD